MRDILLLTHFLSLVVGAGSALSLYIISVLAKRFDASYKAQVLIILFPLRYVSYLGLIFLIVSGLLLAQPFLSSLGYLPWFIAKLILVTLLVMLSVIGVYSMRKIKLVEAGLRPPLFQRLALIGKASVIISISIVICAVMAFH
jgi:uncharacterized membrane protein